MPNERDLTNTERMAALAEWFAYAAYWLEREVADSRIGFVENDGDPAPRVERVAFITDELDAMLTGFRRASDALLEITTSVPPPRCHHLQVVR
jgi:hypothetical protein